MFNIIRLVLMAPLFGMLAAQQPKERDLTIVKKTVPNAASEKKAVTVPRSYAVIIGVGGYPNLQSSMQLPFAEADAESMFRVLISETGGNFKAQNVRKLVGPNATLAKIRETLEVWLPSVTKDDDRVLVYFAGHGFVDAGKAYIAPVDVRMDALGATGYPMDQLGSVFANKVKGKWKVLLTDSCHSGAITPDDIGTVNKSLINLDKSLFVFTASRDRERSFEAKEFGGGHGVFTYFVEQGLTGKADQNEDGIVTADELSEYVRNNVRRATNNQQTPTSDKGSFDPQMLLAYSLDNVKPDAAPEPRQGTMILEANMDDVEVFVDGASVGVLKKGTPLQLPGMKPGPHTVKGVKIGYVPDGPREEMIYPGQESTVSINIKIVQRKKRTAELDVDRGLKFYRDGGEGNYQKAVDIFQKALAIEPEYPEALLYLGRAQNALYDNEKALLTFKKAIELQPDYYQARISYAGMLLDIGDTDLAIRQLTTAIARDKNNGEAHCILAEAYLYKEDYVQSMEAARRAVQLIPSKGESHFFLGQALRMSKQWDEAKRSYQEYLRLSNFDSKLAGQLNYWIRGSLIGGGKKTRASLKDIWAEQRASAYFGICECERRTGKPDLAIANCQQSLRYASADPYTNRQLALLFASKFNEDNRPEALATAYRYMQRMVEINPNMEEAKDARTMLADWSKYFSATGTSTTADSKAKPKSKSK